MPPRLQAIAGLLIYAGIVALLWPVFTGSVDTGVKWAFLVLAALGGLTGIVAWKGRRRWAKYALIGMLPGFVIGGIGFAWLVWLGTAGSADGWEGIAIIAAGIFGSFAGAVTGAVCGASFGLLRDWWTHRSGSLDPT